MRSLLGLVPGMAAPTDPTSRSESEKLSMADPADDSLSSISSPDNLLHADETTTTITEGTPKQHHQEQKQQDHAVLEEAALLPWSHDKQDSTTTSPSTTPDDVLSRKVRQGSRGLGLFCIMTICIGMFCCSFLLLYYFDVQEGHMSVTTTTTTTTTALLPPLPTYQSTDFCPTTSRADNDNTDTTDEAMMILPLGYRLWQFQIHVVQNLVHASLVGSAAIVAVVRGDFLWMTYVRNVGFFFVPVGLSYVVLDTWSLCFQHSLTFAQVGPRLLLASVTALAGLGALVDYSRVFFRIRYLLQARVQGGFPSSVTTTGEYYPHDLAATRSEAGLATLIYLCATLVQCVAWLYYVTTLFEWMVSSSLSSCQDAHTVTTTTTIMSTTATTPVVTPLKTLQQFEMSYSSGSHQALLISLFFLAATYPRDLASAGGALLTSTWRLTTGVGALFHLLREENPISSSTLWSWVNASVEVALMLPICVASLVLVTRILQRQLAVTSPGENNGLRFTCPTALQISTSPRYSPEQQKGARLLKNGTALLLTEFTCECVIMLRLNHIGTNATHEIYKWGMHVCVMYIFCNVMCVETPFIYHKARKLLFVACPSGSLVALIQMYMMWTHTPDMSQDAFAQLVLCLLFVRALSGVIQVLGLFYLKHTEIVQGNPSGKEESVGIATDLQIRRQLGLLEKVLWGVYAPVMLIYVATFAVVGSCSPPFVSTSLYAETCTDEAGALSDFSLAQSLPGMGLFFHYGMIIVIFAANGAQPSTPTYKPSLMIASLFCVHVSALIAVDLCWDVVQTDLWSEISSIDVLRRILLVCWMLASFLLWISCERVLKMRLRPL